MLLTIQILFFLLVACVSDKSDNLDSADNPDYSQQSLSWTPVGGDGWTAYEPHEDTVIFYVSSSMGDDVNDGLSEDTPVQTVARGLALLKERSESGTIARPDWLLFKSGDSWNEVFAFRNDTIKGGVSIAHPLLISSYGEGPRPHFIWPDTGPAFSYGWWGGDFPTGDDAPVYWSIVGLSFYNPIADPNSSQFQPTRIYDASSPPTVYFGSEARHVLIEDCKMQYISLVVQFGVQKVSIRRNLFLDNYGYHGQDGTEEVYSHAQGLYMFQIQDAIIEENLFDHNGWLDSEVYPTTAPTIYNHNVYLNFETDGVVLHRNISTRAASDGFKVRGGGKAINNLLLANGIHINMNGVATEGVETTMRYNVMLKSLEQPLEGPAESFGGYERDWGVAIGWVNENPLDITGNLVIHSPGGGEALAGVCRESSGCNEGHIVYNWGEEENTVADFPEPERNLESYLSSIGDTPTFEFFLEQVRSQSKSNWKSQYTAAAVNDYIREGFGIEMEE